MKVWVIGANGNMGRRYISILKYLGVDYLATDKDEYVKDSDLEDCSHIMIATPSSTHLEILKVLAVISKKTGYQFEILCEKPLLDPKNAGWDSFYEMANLFKQHDQLGNAVYMVNNYAYYPGLDDGYGVTSYDFYHSGGDGLEWDCIQLIHLADIHSEVLLSNKSPIWTAYINGHPLCKDKMDQTYVDMITDFVYRNQDKLWSYPDVICAHLKVINYQLDRKIKSL